MKRRPRPPYLVGRSGFPAAGSRRFLHRSPVEATKIISNLSRTGKPLTAGRLVGQRPVDEVGVAVGLLRRAGRYRLQAGGLGAAYHIVRQVQRAPRYRVYRPQNRSFHLHSPFHRVLSPGGGKVCGMALQGKAPAQSAQGLACITFYRGRTAGFFKSDDVAAGAGTVAFCGVVSPGGGKVCGKALQSKTPAQSAQGLAYITFYRGRTAGFFQE